MRVTRKDFLKASFGAMRAYAGLLVLGACGSSNHPHSIMVVRG